MSSPPVCAQVAMPLLLPLAPLVGAPAAVAIVVIGVAVVAAALIVMTGWHKRTVDGYAGLPAPPPAPKVERGPGAAGPFPPQKDRCANRSLGRVRRNACSHARPPPRHPSGHYDGFLESGLAAGLLWPMAKEVPGKAAPVDASAMVAKYRQRWEALHPERGGASVHSGSLRSFAVVNKQLQTLLQPSATDAAAVATA